MEIMKKRKNFDPWHRSRHPDCKPRLSADDLYYVDKLSKKWRKFDAESSTMNSYFKTKNAALYASVSVVSLVSYTGEERLYESCGTIIEADERNVVTVITSANLIVPPTGGNIVADNLKVVVHSSDCNSYEGEICAYDFYYNLLVVKFKSAGSVVPATLRIIDDSSTLRLYGKSFQLRPHSVKLEAGNNNTVIAVARYFYKPFELMLAAGRFSRDRCRYDCKELLTTTCHITRCGDGCPLVNLSGEVIGVNFYDFAFRTPFMPINIVKKWWDHYKRQREFYHPCLGFEACNLYVADVDLIESVLRSVLPRISDGVIVEKVIPESSAHCAGLLENDVIVKCNGKTIESFLQLMDIVWNNTGGTVYLEVVRAECSSLLKFKVMIVEATSNQMNSWPRWKYW